VPSPGSRIPPLGRRELPPRKIAWLLPTQLLRTAYHVWLSTTASEFLDRREVLAALDPNREVQAFRQLGNDGGVWLDFVADIGDSWEATHAVATLLAQKQLCVDGYAKPLRYADIVVLGGDLVYPTPTRRRYRDRMRIPLGAALPQAECAYERQLYAIPGNHDWYDGLTNFVREFCQEGYLGGWRLRQRRSYFAVKLMPRWWLWGIDIALDTRIDPAQQTYFLDILRNKDAQNKDARPRPRFERGDNIILCTAKPSWLQASRYSADACGNLTYFVKEIIEPNSGRVPLLLAGDLHHYCRYEGPQGEQMVIAGGGGAYLMGTHNLPREVPALGIPPTALDEPREPDMCRAADFPYPSHTDSRRLALRALLLAFRPANWLFCVVVGSLYFSLIRLGPDVPGLSWNTLRTLLTSAPPRPFIYVVSAVLIASALFAALVNERRLLAAFWGIAHGLAHVALALVLSSIVAPQWLAAVGPMRLLVPAGVLALGGLAGGTLIGAYLIASDRLFGWHHNEVFAVTSIIDYRNFVRMHLAPDGSCVELFAVGMRRVPRKWRSRIDRLSDCDGYYEPVDDRLKPHLIEGPITVRPIQVP
jgi:hypothetical protein